MVAVLLVLLPAPPSSAGTPVVTKTADSLDGTCDADCSLREAVIAANAAPDPDTIQLAGGTYTLTIEGDTEDASEFGDLDVLNDLTIVGAGPEATVIDGAWASNPDRVLDMPGTGADLVLSGLTIRDGDVTPGDGGGGIVVDAGNSLTATDVDLRSNRGDYAGGAYSDGTATLSRVRFVGNVGESSSSGGGGFYNFGTSIFNDVAFIGNTSDCCGAAMYVEGPGITLTNATFSGNSSASNDGGALYLSSVSGTNSLTNVTFSGNSSASGDGGAIYGSSGPTLAMNNVTMTGNTAGGDGGGFYQDGTTVTLRNSIISGNTDAGGQSPDCGQSAGDAFTSGGHNLIGSTTGCMFTPGTGDLSGMAPLLGPLADNGGFTETHALLPGSPAVDKGGTDCAATDQRDAPRSGVCDIGAYELVFCKAVVANRIGTEGADVLTGTSGRDGFLVFGGNDKVTAQGGNDAACLGAGNDRASGGGGKDKLFGEQGNDRLNGQGGGDLLACGPGKKDVGRGGPGRDKARKCEKGLA